MTTPRLLLLFSVLLNLGLVGYFVVGKLMTPKAPLPITASDAVASSQTSLKMMNIYGENLQLATPQRASRRTPEASHASATAAQDNPVPPMMQAQEETPSIASPSTSSTGGTSSASVFGSSGFAPASAVSGGAPARQTLDPSAPGNSFTHKGVTMSAMEVTTSKGSNGYSQDLGVDVTPAANSASDNGNSGSNDNGDQNNASPNGFGNHSSLFTPEELLFRAKWGWQAFYSAQAAATAP